MIEIFLLCLILTLFIFLVFLKTRRTTPQDFGKTITVDATPFQTMRDVKLLLSDTLGIPHEQQKTYDAQGKLTDDNLPLGLCKNEHLRLSASNANFHLQVRLVEPKDAQKLSNSSSYKELQQRQQKSGTVPGFSRRSTTTESGSENSSTYPKKTNMESYNGKGSTPMEREKKDSTSPMDKSEKTEKNGNMLKEVSQLMEKIESLTTRLNKKEEALKDQTFKLEKLSRKMQEKEVYFKEKVKSFEEKQLSYQDQLTEQSLNYDSLYSKYIVKTHNSTSLAKKYKKLKADLEVMSKEKQDSNESTCNVCLTDPKNTVLVPCGHCFCVDCVGALCARDNTQCPVCRQQFRECVRFFM